MTNILILENEVSIGLLLNQVFTRQGHRVEVVSRGEEALERIDRGGLDLLISDLFLSGMGGLEVLQALQARGVTLPTLVISGFIDPGVQAELAALDNVRGWLRKPFDLGELLSRVGECLTAPPAPPPPEPATGPDRPAQPEAPP